jgi:cytoskeletal protein RodZ
MSIGTGIFLITVGAIVAFGIRDRSGAVDLTAVGVIVMLAGAAGIWLSYNITRKRQQAVETQAIDPAVEEEYRQVQQTSTPTPPPPEPTATPPAGPTTEPAAEELVPVAEEPASKVETERRVELDPAANGLHTPVPNRTIPTSVEVPVPPTHRTTWPGRLIERFKRTSR